MKIYKCRICGNTVLLIENGGGALVCCNKEMEELKCNVSGSDEFHIPVFKRKNRTINIQISRIKHPMTEMHYIEYVIIETNKGYSLKKLDKEPEVDFELSKDERVKSVYAYCNLHGLWRLDVNE